jgi:MSHA biogenesis protein MshO
MRHPVPSRRGFSLIEFLMVLTIVSIIAAALLPMLRETFKAYDQTANDIVVMDKLRYATERLAREVREVNFTSGVGSFTAASGSSMTFTRSVADGASPSATPTSATVSVGTTATTVTLAWSTIASGVAQTLTDELGSLAFVYLDGSGNTMSASPLATLNSSVRAVQITLTLTHDGRTFSERTRVTLKNGS